MTVNIHLECRKVGNYENTPTQIYWKFTTKKNENFQIKKNPDIFHISAQKHWLWVLVRTASVRRFLRVPTIYVVKRNKKTNAYPFKPQFYYIKVDFKEVKIIKACFCDEECSVRKPCEVLRQKTNFRTYAPNKDSDKLVHSLGTD